MNSKFNCSGTISTNHTHDKLYRYLVYCVAELLLFFSHIIIITANYTTPVSQPSNQSTRTDRARLTTCSTERTADGLPWQQVHWIMIIPTYHYIVIIIFRKLDMHGLQVLFKRYRGTRESVLHLY